MSIKLNQEIWMYVERVYIHCYNSEEFKIFLKKYGIEYESDVYLEFEKSGKTHELPIYKFMSEPNYAFAHFIQTIPTYKYLPILQQIVFDSKIIATRKDGWNYYGEPIRNWHQKIVEILRTAGVNINTNDKKLSISEPEEDFYGPDFLPYDFTDLFLDYIRKEINESYNNGQLLAVIVLSRKLLENLIIRILEVVFPKNTGGAYNQSNHELWYNKSKSHYHGFETLLTNLNSKSSDFHEDEDLVKQVCEAIQNVRVQTNQCIHRDYKIPDDVYLKSLKIEMAVVNVRRIYKKYCNP